MSGEIQGTAVILTNGTGTIIGQGDFSLTYGGTPIEISNKSHGDWITYLDGDGATKQFIFSGEFTYNDDAQYRKVKSDSISHTMDTYTMTLVGSGVVTDESYTGTFMPTGLSDSYARGVKVATTLSFNSSNEVTYTEAADV